MELQFVCVRVRVETCCREAWCPPYFFGLDGLRREQRVVAAHMTSVSMWVPHDDVPLRVRRVLAIADQPFSLAPTLFATPVPAVQHQGAHWCCFDRSPFSACALRPHFAQASYLPKFWMLWPSERLAFLSYFSKKGTLCS